MAKHSNTTPRDFRSALKQLVQSVTLPDTNQPEEQTAAKYLYIGKQMKDEGEMLMKAAKAEITSTHENKFPQPGMGKVEVINAMPFIVTVKRDNPRNTFDQSAFIKQVAEKYNLSAAELSRMALNCTKQSAAPTSIEAVLQQGNGDD
jgi:hypothetical protein